MSENQFENVICKTSAILFALQHVQADMFITYIATVKPLIQVAP